VARHLNAEAARDFSQRARKLFTVNACASVDGLMRALREGGRGTLAAAIREGRQLVVLRLMERAAAESAMRGLAPEVRELDVSILHGLVLEGIFGLGPAEISAGENLEYTIHAGEAIEAVLGGRADGAFLMNAPSIADVERVCDAGATMPEKSTYFYPKLVTGLVMNPLDGVEDE
jgi:hypothetical protein